MSKATQEIKNQKMSMLAKLLAAPRIIESEKQRLQTVFGADMVIYKALRDCFFGFELDEADKQLVTSIIPVKDLIRKIFIPEVTKDIAIGQNYDLWQTQDIRTSNPDSYKYFYEAKVKILEMLRKSLDRVTDPNLEGVDLEVKDNNFAFVIARNGYISYVDQQIRFIIQFVNMDSLTDEERLKMMQMNSNK